MENEKKKEIKLEMWCDLDNEFFSGDIDAVADRIKNIPNKMKEHELVKENPDMFHRFELGVDYCSDGGVDYNVIGIRWETDEELAVRTETNYKARLASIRTAQIKADKLEENEKSEYARLKAKYENG